MIYSLVILIVLFVLLFLLEKRGVRIGYRIGIAAIGIAVMTMTFIAAYVSDNLKRAFSEHESTVRTLIAVTNGNSDFLRSLSAREDDVWQKHFIDEAIALQVGCMKQSMVLPEYDTAEYIGGMRELTEKLKGSPDRPDFEK